MSEGVRYHISRRRVLGWWIRTPALDGTVGTRQDGAGALQYPCAVDGLERLGLRGSFVRRPLPHATPWSGCGRSLFLWRSYSSAYVFRVGGVECFVWKAGVCV